MKRIGNIFGRIVSLENLRLADEKASKGKSSQPGVIQHRQNSDANLLLLQQMLTGKTYRTSKYTTFKIYEPKEREIFRLPYFPDRIGQFKYPVVGVVYTIRGIHEDKGVWLEEIINPLHSAFTHGGEICFGIHHFRELQPPMSLEFIQELQQPQTV